MPLGADRRAACGVAQVTAAKARGDNPYPHKFHVSIQLPAYVAQYGSLEPGQQVPEEGVSLAGRVVRKAASGAKLIFFDLRSEGAKIQVMCDARNFGGALEDFQRLMNSVKRGDIVGVGGFPGKSKRGELSVFPRSLQVRPACRLCVGGGGGVRVGMWVLVVGGGRQGGGPRVVPRAQARQRVARRPRPCCARLPACPPACRCWRPACTCRRAATLA